MIPHPPDSSNDNPPAGFDPAAFPIIAEHVFGVTSERVKRTHQVEYLHHLGPRPFLEFLNELAAANDIGPDVDHRLARYAELDAEVVALVGGRHLPPAPLVGVPR